LARVLAFVLLVFVAHSATVEVVHQHGNLLAAKSTSAASFLDASTNPVAPESSGSTGECLICQLHQHLFSTLLISIPGLAPPQAEEAIARQSFVSLPGRAHTPQRGRAPPETSLL
jgi:hypothetical protein